MVEQKRVNLRNVNAGKDEELPQAYDVNLPGLRGTLPFVADRTIGSMDDLPKAVEEEENKYRTKPDVVPEHIKKKAFTPQKPVDISTLPEEQQAELLENIAKAVTRPPAQFIPRGPGIGEAMAMADRAAAKTEEKLSKAEKPKLAPKVEPKPEPAPEPAPAPSEEQEETTDTTEAGIAVAATTNCIHCGWAVGSTDACNPTSKDKQNFVVSVLGQTRFFKDYELLGGKLRVTFRTLTVDETDLVIKQLMADWNDNKISGPAHSVAEATRYQLALSLESVESSMGPINLPPLSSYDYDEPESGTILPTIVDYINEKAMSNEPLRRIISKAYGHFIDTVSKLEAMAETPDFWQATED